MLDTPTPLGCQVLLASGELERRAEQAWARLADCTLCPCQCHANRLQGKLGVCRTGALARVAEYFPHHGEERVLSGSAGSGTVFFSRCNQHCIFCQNAEISQADAGRLVEPAELAGVFLELQARACHNINLVTPSHVVPQILAALVIAARAGLNLPVVFNTGGYDSLDTLRLLDGVIDIYLPDMKFNDASIARQLSGSKDYPAVNRAAVREMQRQVGTLALDADGLARRGLIIRHLVLPNQQAGTRGILRFISAELSPDTALNLMDQYHPAYRSAAIAAINRPVRSDEVQKAFVEARAAGLHNFLN